MSQFHSISDLTREFGVSTRTIRFYEDEGLIRPVRRGRTRLFRPSDRMLLGQILRGKRLGFSIAEIREIIALYKAPTGERAQLEKLAEAIASKRAQLEQKRRDIEETLREMDEADRNVRARMAEIGGDGTGGDGTGRDGTGGGGTAAGEAGPGKAGGAQA